MISWQITTANPGDTDIAKTINRWRSQSQLKSIKSKNKNNANYKIKLKNHKNRNNLKKQRKKRKNTNRYQPLREISSKTLRKWKEVVISSFVLDLVPLTSQP